MAVSGLTAWLVGLLSIRIRQMVAAKLDVQ